MTNLNIQATMKKQHGSLLLDAFSADPSVARQFKMITSLNRSGRNYLVLERANKQKAVDVLGKVVDDLDCLYFHLRDNPVLCVRDDLSVSDRPRKRARQRLDTRRNGYSLPIDRLTS